MVCADCCSCWTVPARSSCAVSYVRHNRWPGEPDEPVQVDTHTIEGRLCHSSHWSSNWFVAPGKSGCGTVYWRKSLPRLRAAGGEHLKYLVLGQGRPVACLAWSSARVIWAVATATLAGAPKSAVVMSASSAYNTRFLILPWVKVNTGVAYPGDWRCDLRRLAADHGHPIYFLETFVIRNDSRDCYRAANWWCGQDDGTW